MQRSPQELKDRLLKALDRDYNVVDMPVVLEIFSILEKYPITRENLEQTRLGRHVNDLRRHTPDKDLSKRAKQLVRKWQKLLQSPGPPAAVVNGDGPVESRVSALRAPAPNATQSSRPASPAARGPTPAARLATPTGRPPTPASRPNTPCARPATPSARPTTPSARPATPAGRPATPTGRPTATPSCQSRVSPVNNTRPAAGNAAPVTSQVKSSRHSPKFVNSLSVSSTKPQSPALSGQVSDQHAVSSKKSVAHHVANNSHANTPTSTTSKTHTTGKRKRPAVESIDVANNHNKKSASCDNSDSTSLPSTPTSTGIKLRIKQERTINGLVSHAEVMGQNRNGDITDETDLNCTSVAERGEHPHTSKNNFTDSTSNASCSEQWDGIANKTLERTTSSSSLTPKTPKVKTTVQLIKELHQSAGLPLRATETVTKIALNQIQKEDDWQESVVPAGAKPRPRRKPLLPPVHSDKSLSETKNERIQSFLMSAMGNSSGQPEPECDLNNLLKMKLEPPISEEFVDVESPQTQDLLITGHRANGGTDQSDVGVSDTPSGQAQPVTCDNDVMRDPWSHLPPLDVDSIDWSEPPDVVPTESQEVTDSMVDRLHSNHWSGVNGQFDASDEWCDWTRCFSMPSHNGHLLHILPYVDIDG